MGLKWQFKLLIINCTVMWKLSQTETQSFQWNWRGIQNSTAFLCRNYVMPCPIQTHSDKTITNKYVHIHSAHKLESSRQWLQGEQAIKCNFGCHRYFGQLWPLDGAVSAPIGNNTWVQILFRWLKPIKKCIQKSCLVVLLHDWRSEECGDGKIVIRHFRWKSMMRENKFVGSVENVHLNNWT
jgi:hypothetical protein